MPNKQLEVIARNPQFKQMVKRRHRMVWGLSMAVLAIHIAYILVMSYAPALFAEPLQEGGYITKGVIYYLLIIALGIGAPAYYSWWSNARFDPVRQGMLAAFEKQAAGVEDE